MLGGVGLDSSKGKSPCLDVVLIDRQQHGKASRVCGRFFDYSCRKASHSEPKKQQTDNRKTS